MIRKIVIGWLLILGMLVYVLLLGLRDLYRWLNGAR